MTAQTNRGSSPKVVAIRLAVVIRSGLFIDRDRVFRQAVQGENFFEVGVAVENPWMTPHLRRLLADFLGESMEMPDRQSQFFSGRYSAVNHGFTARRFRGRPGGVGAAAI